MENLTTHWRPHGTIRAKSLAIVHRDDRILVCAIPDDTGAIKGWRPLGGTVEHGEYARDTVVRELREEIFATAEVKSQIGVIENIYEHHGVAGHEIAFIFDVALRDAGIAQPDEFVVDDEGTRFACAWVKISEFRSGAAELFPTGLLAYL